MTDTRTGARVFVSYSQEDGLHNQRCRELTDRLRNDGVEAWIDQYESAPPEGWPRWMLRQFDETQFVIQICTPTFCRRFEGTETPGRGKGATWEGLLATQALYESGTRNTKFVPVLFEGTGEEAVPIVLRGFTRYTLWGGYDALYRYITDQPAVVPPPVGSRRVMGPLTDGVAPQKADLDEVKALIDPELERARAKFDPVAGVDVPRRLVRVTVEYCRRQGIPVEVRRSFGEGPDVPDFLLLEL